MSWLVPFVLFSVFLFLYNRFSFLPNTYSPPYPFEKRAPAPLKDNDSIKPTGRICLNPVEYIHNPEERCTIRRLNGETLTIIRETVIYSDGLPDLTAFGLHLCDFKSDKEIEAFIRDHTLEAIKAAVQVSKKDDYVLNIMCVEPHPAMPEEGEIKFAAKQMEIYSPIVRHFLLHGFKSLFESLKEEKTF